MNRGTGERENGGGSYHLLRGALYRLLPLFLSPILPFSAQAQPAITGFVEPNAAVRAGGDGAFLSGRTRARADLDVSLDRGALAVRNEVTYDLLGDSLSYVLREAYAEAYGLFDGRIDLRVGHQLVAWGETDAAFVTDVLAPLDLSEFVAQPPERLRLALTAARATAFLGDWTLDALWVPVSPQSRLPGEASPWRPYPEAFAVNDSLLLPPVPIVGMEAERPEARIGTSEGAARLTWRGLPLTDLTLLVHDGTNRIPGFAVRPRFSFLRGPEIAVTPAYRRRTVVGGSFETAFVDPFVLRGEAAYTSRALFSEALPTEGALLDSTLIDSVERGFLTERSQVEAALSAERTFGAHLFRLTGIGRWIGDGAVPVAADAFQPAVLGLWNGRFRRETVMARALAFWNVGEDAWLNASLGYALRDALLLEVGAHVFEGLGGEDESALLGGLRLEQGAFGLYDANDLVYARLRYSF